MEKQDVEKRLLPVVRRVLPVATVALLMASQANAAWLVPADITSDIAAIGTGTSLWVAAGVGVAIGAYSTGFGWSAMTSIIKGAFKKAFG